MKIRNIQMIEVQDWDELVQKTYGRPYAFQQQDGCKSRGTFELTVPSDGTDFERTTVPELVNDPMMGVSFAAWLARDPKQKLEDQEHEYQLALWWERNFYPSIEMVANDLHAKGLLATGTYTINIDW